MIKIYAKFYFTFLKCVLDDTMHSESIAQKIIKNKQALFPQ